MNLYDCRIPYTQVSTQLLRPIATKAVLLTAIQIHRTKSLAILTAERPSLLLTRHERRLIAETKSQPLTLGIVAKTAWSTRSHR